MKFYQFCASKIQSACNCSGMAVISATDTNANDMWRLKSAHHIEQLEDAVKNLAPSGSGFDSGTTLDIEASTDKKLVFRTSFHHMDDNGSYDGWTVHTVIVRPTFNGVSVSVGGRNRNSIKEYITDIFYNLGEKELDWTGKTTG